MVVLWSLLLSAWAAAPAARAQEAPGPRFPGSSKLAAPLAGIDTDGQATCSSGAVSMLQRSAGAQRAALSRHSSPALPDVRRFEGASMLTMLLPVSEELKKEAAAGNFFGTDMLQEGLELLPDGLAELRLSYFPQAEIGWSGAAGSSEPVNVPHRLLTVRLPVSKGGRRDLPYVQTAYALTDDDIAMLTYRMGSGVPAKLANISLETAGELPAGKVSVSRRGLDLMEVRNLRDLGVSTDADVAALEQQFSQVEVDFDTDLGHFMPVGSTVAFEKHTVAATIRESRRVALDLVLSDGSWDGIRWMFSSLEPLSAWWVRADLELRTAAVAVKRTKTGKGLSETAFGLRTSGEVTTQERLPYKSGLHYSYTNGDVIYFHMQMNAGNVAPYLPPGVSLAGDEGLLWQVRWQPADPLSPLEGKGINLLDMEYNELWVVVPVTYKGRPSFFPLLMLLDDDVAMVGGQAMGCPKKLANLTYTFSQHPPAAGAQVKLDVSRRGRPAIKLSGRIEDTADKTPVLGVNDNSEPGGSIMWMMSHQYPWDPSVDRPRYTWARGMQTTKAQLALTDMHVELGTGAPEPLGMWFSGQPTRGGYIRMDQDWGMSKDIPFSWNLKEQPDAAGYAQWWQRAFPVMYM